MIRALSNLLGKLSQPVLSAEQPISPKMKVATEITSIKNELSEDRETRNNRSLGKLRLKTIVAYLRYRDSLAAQNEEIRVKELKNYFSEIMEALDIFDELDDEYYRSAALHCMSNIFVYTGDVPAARIALSNICVDFIKESAVADFKAGKHGMEQHFQSILDKS
jgi:hypothetical protein